MIKILRFIAAPGILGALLLGLVSCEKQQSSPTWEGQSVLSDASPPATETPPTAAPATETPPTETPPTAAPPTETPPTAAPATETPPTLRFVAYNVQNWLTMDRYIDRKRVSGKPKPEEEKQAVIEILARHRPDVIGLCEIGTPDDLAELQDRLKAAGIDLPHAHHTGGADDVRRLAMLSRHPFASIELHEDLTYELEGRSFGMGRGILDATVDSPVGQVRFLGTHLKSKREIPEADQEMMRRAEAHLLREQATRILKADPGAPLIVYGDLNDTRGSSSIRTIRGPNDGPLKLGMAWLTDKQGETWTHFWSYQDVYSRFDYVLFSNSITHRAVWDECRILDDPEWKDASDHRALLFVLSPG